jgi:Spy/CpxP family protein refolding chaperone
MKSLKVIITAIALCVATGSTALAQEKKGKQTPEQQIERIEQAVGSLTADQKKKITAIIAKSSEAMQGIPKEERKEKGAAITKKQTDDINAVLTADQRSKWAAAKKKK